MLVELGNLPPLTLEFAQKLGSHRRAISSRWFAALLLIGSGGGVLLVNALLSVRSPPVLLPRYRRTDAILSNASPSVRGDSLMVAGQQAEAVANHARIEQLNDTGLSIKPFTHVILHLGQSADIPATPSQGVSPSDVSACSDCTGSAMVRTASGPALPPEILFGASRSVRTPALAYAAPDEAVQRMLPAALGTPINITVATRTLRPKPGSRRVVLARPQDRLADILQALGTTRADADEIASVLWPSGWFGPQTMSGGEKVIVESGPEAEPTVRPWRISVERVDTSVAAVALADNGHYRRIVSDAASSRPSADTSAVEGAVPNVTTGRSLREALYQSGEANGLDRTLLDQALRLIGHDMDLETAISSSDTVELLCSQDDLGQPELTFLALTLSRRTKRYYRFKAPDDDGTDFYDRNGQSVTPFILRKPVAAGRLGDGFGWRIHPVLGDRRFHEGVDYAAPFGSPIVAAGAGVVEKIDQQWGYGKYIRLRHDLGYETTYAHIAGVPPGLQVGDRVRQGQTIAFVGSTGLSTGPHLYYEIRINGRDVDPLRVQLFGGRMLSGDTFAAFRSDLDRTDALLHATDAAGPLR